MELDSPLQPRLRLTDGWPLAGWVIFYLLVVASWLALAGAGPLDLAGLVARCLAPAADNTWLSLVAMWSLMSLAMMLPTSLPTLVRLNILVQQGARPVLRFSAFLLGYIAIWLGFAVAAGSLQLVLARVTPVSLEPSLAGGLLLGAGLYQFSRLKQACLTRCRHPMTFFMAHWRQGLDGAVAMGLRHGRDCLGCCWALMSLALIGGTMSLAWMGLGLGLMILEKLAGTGRFVTAPLGLILIAGAFYQWGLVIFAA
jgi:predicted metal-binding membrane protein